eukprot:GHVR01139564.1.p1 GENE.GHVR01139564.1~~GHVR01139564.1.p1  ORF type:complete len:130 (+),score=2.82 GHVR01139564.1:38-427(+)
MSGAVKRTLFFPGIVPRLQQKCLAMNPPAAAKAIILSPIGPFSIHFYAPFVKWSISFANLLDINRPVEKMSIPQQTAISLTGFIWSRYCMVITPRNWLLFAVNVSMGVTGSWQLFRVYMFQHHGKVITI